jgi:hypothetical protein
VRTYTLPDLCELNVQVACSTKGMGKPRIEGRTGEGAQENLTGLLEPWNVTSGIKPMYIPAICCARYIGIYFPTTYCTRCSPCNIPWQYPLSSRGEKHRPPITLSRQVYKDRSNYIYIKKEGSSYRTSSRIRNAIHLERRSLAPLATSCLLACSCLRDLLSAFVLGRGRRQGRERVGRRWWRNIFNLCVRQDDCPASMLDLLSWQNCVCLLIEVLVARLGDLGMGPLPADSDRDSVSIGHLQDA